MSDSDSDDDLPIMDLIKKRKRLEQLKSNKKDNKNNVIKPEKVFKPERVNADRSSNGQSSSSSSSNNAKSSSSYNNIAAEFYDTTKKGKLYFHVDSNFPLLNCLVY